MLRRILSLSLRVYYHFFPNLGKNFEALASLFFTLVLM